MASERTWNAVAPVLLTANGTTTGLLQVVDTIGLYYGMQATLKNNSTQLTVYVGLVVDSTHVWVRAQKNSPDYNVDLTAFTLSSNSTLSAAVQNKSLVPMESRLLSTYETDPVDAWRVKSVDPYGNAYTPSSPFPVNIIPPSQIPFTLGVLALPNLIQQYTAGLTYNQVVSETVDNEEILTFNEGSAFVGELTLTKTDIGWILNVGVPEDSFLLLEDGDVFLLEDGGGLLLE